jgi:S-DNA-T family DNA segregation ATPase FtsK/SpoIIIE
MSRDLARRWTVPGAPTVRLLARQTPLADLPAALAEPDRGVAFALNENNLVPVYVYFEQGPFFLVSTRVSPASPTCCASSSSS